METKSGWAPGLGVSVLGAERMSVTENEGSLHESARSVRHLGHGLRAGMSAAPLMAAARVAAGVTSLKCQEPTFHPVSIATARPHDANSSSRALASFKSSVSKPSVNQP
jgi:hypothetical protein